ncbi:hypothetical protein PoB_006774900 [Plakobranchus ocellatus]|uniref:Uncharacterized protein n=1 Tax=Plakobranchus ocellatus TaxID=259542 RepID=A0AAV4DAI2_9GAST|nr:hypothetical protein PoB_006774900 [Plakobranchus ocellatus]
MFKSTGDWVLTLNQQKSQTAGLQIQLHGTDYESQNMEDIALHYFVTNHGQSKEDSAHSAIATALQSAGNVFLPSQLLTIFALVRANDLYTVEPLQWEDSLDFKTVARELRILDARKDSNAEEIVWSKIMEMGVSKQHFYTIFDSKYMPLFLKRLQKKI